MHPSFQQHIDELGALLVHSNEASMEFFRRNRFKSRRGARFQVVTKKLGLFHVIERHTGKTWIFHHYQEATDFAIELEEQSNRRRGGSRSTTS